MNMIDFEERARSARHAAATTVRDVAVDEFTPRQPGRNAAMLTMVAAIFVVGGWAILQQGRGGTLVESVESAEQDENEFDRATDDGQTDENRSTEDATDGEAAFPETAPGFAIIDPAPTGRRATRTENFNPSEQPTVDIYGRSGSITPFEENGFFNLKITDPEVVEAWKENFEANRGRDETIGDRQVLILEATATWIDGDVLNALSPVGNDDITRLRQAVEELIAAPDTPPLGLDLLTDGFLLDGLEEHRVAVEGIVYSQDDDAGLITATLGTGPSEEADFVANLVYWERLGWGAEEAVVFGQRTSDLITVDDRKIQVIHGGVFSRVIFETADGDTANLTYTTAEATVPSPDERLTTLLEYVPLVRRASDTEVEQLVEDAPVDEADVVNEATEDAPSAIVRFEDESFIRIDTESDRLPLCVYLYADAIGRESAIECLGTPVNFGSNFDWYIENAPANGLAFIELDEKWKETATATVTLTDGTEVEAMSYEGLWIFHLIDSASPETLALKSSDGTVEESIPFPPDLVDGDFERLTIGPYTSYPASE